MDGWVGESGPLLVHERERESMWDMISGVVGLKWSFEHILVAFS